MITKDQNFQYYQNGTPVFTLGQLCKFLNYPKGRNLMISDFKNWGLLLNRGEPSERMKANNFLIYHMLEIKTKSGIKIGKPIVLATMEGVVYLRGYVKRKLATTKN